MRDHVLLGRGREMGVLPRAAWESELARAPEHCAERLRFMGPDHHRVRYFVVEELARRNRPLSIGAVADALTLAPEVVTGIVDELERNLFFLVRNDDGEVTWAYPVTVDRTPHRLTFSTGERLHGAWGEDALATSFVQGRLRHERIAIEIETECGCCGRELRLHSVWDGGSLGHEVVSEGAEPLVFEPQIDWAEFSEPTIIHAY